ncbi:hypothetical protein [Streptacidiphilus sp. PAMC 29251]
MSTPTLASFEVDFRLPPDFREIIAGASPEEARDAVTARYGPEVMATIPAVLLDAAVAVYEEASARLGREGVFYAAGCLGLIDGDLTLSSLTVARTQVDCPSPGTAVDGVVRIMGRGQGSDLRQAKRYELPAGPAAVVVESSVGLLLPAADLGTDEDLPLQVATLQAYIPVPRAADPTAGTMVVVTFSTPSVRHWEVYCPVVVDLLRSLRFPAAEAASVPPPPAPQSASPAPEAPVRSTIRNALG